MVRLLENTDEASREMSLIFSEIGAAFHTFDQKHDHLQDMMKL